MTKFKGKCLTPQDILLAFGLQPHHSVIISPNKYLQICPAIIYELDNKLCQIQDEYFQENKEYYLGWTKKKKKRIPNPITHSFLQFFFLIVWIYATISILIMGISGMVCVLIVPVVKKHGYSYVIQFLVSLAAGTLCGDALIHLLPHVININLFFFFKFFSI